LTMESPPVCDLVWMSGFRGRYNPG
jgi:hypothetical protein